MADTETPAPAGSGKIETDRGEEIPLPYSDVLPAAPKIAIAGLVFNGILLIFEFLCFVQSGWIVGNYELECSLVSCSYTIDGIAFSTTFDHMGGDCENAANGTKYSLLFGYIGYVFCLFISMMFIFGDQIKHCTFLNGMKTETVMTYAATVTCFIAQLLYLAGWSSFINNAVNGDFCFTTDFDAEGGASLIFFGIFWFLRLPFCVVFWYGSDTERGTNFMQQKDVEDAQPAAELQEDPTASQESRYSEDSVSDSVSSSVDDPPAGTPTRT